MSKFGLFALVIALLTSIVSCDKSEDPDVYYVKYKVYENAENLEIEHVSVNTENGIQRLYGDSDFEVIVGPVGKGFEASMVVEGSGLMEEYVFIEILVSVNDGPFALKLQERGILGFGSSEPLQGSMSATYTVGE